jgi:cobalt-zinc-cadmium efflux system outer membrane protein
MQVRVPKRRLCIWLLLLVGGLLGAIGLNVDPTARAQDAVAQQPADIKKPAITLSERLKIPSDLPGADAAPIPKAVASPNKDEREKAVDRLYRPLPPPGMLPQAAPGLEGRPLSLRDLQQLGFNNSPLIRQAAADVEAARGAAIQAGAYPNPNVGYESDQVKPGVDSGQQGWFIEQLIKTAGKLRFAQAAAVMDLRNAELALRRAQSDLAAQIGAGYFAVLVAQANVRVNAALSRLAEQAYSIQVDQLKGGQAAAYEPMQLRVLALQARTNLVQAHNRSISAWKQLAASLGLPGLPPTELEGRADMPIPRVAYETALARVLSAHTDVQTAENAQLRARYSLRLAQVTPIPDVDARGVFQHDNAAPGHDQYGLQIGIALPIWDRNRGGILQAEGVLARAQEEAHRVRDDLSTRLADAFERYENNRIILDYYHTQILPDQVRAYMGVYERHGVEPDKVSFGDVVNAQQTLATTINAYIAALAAQWQAVTDLAALLQTDDVFSLGAGECMAPIPDLEHLPPLPCSHPCSPLPEAALHTVDGNWPPAVAPEQRLPMPRPR